MASQIEKGTMLLVKPTFGIPKKVQVLSTPENGYAYLSEKVNLNDGFNFFHPITHIHDLIARGIVEILAN